MATETTRQGVLVLGRSRLVIDGALAGLRDLGYRADGTNEFGDVLTRFDATAIDLAIFGGQVPPDRKAELREEIAAVNPNVIFVDGLAGIPGLIVDQIQGAFAADQERAVAAPTFDPGDRTIRLNLAGAADVRVTAWWQTTFVPPDPRSDSLVLLDARLEAGSHAVAVPDGVPARAAFASVRIDGVVVDTLGIATER